MQAGGMEGRVKGVGGDKDEFKEDSEDMEDKDLRWQSEQVPGSVVRSQVGQDFRSALTLISLQDTLKALLLSSDY